MVIKVFSVLAEYFFKAAPELVLNFYFGPVTQNILTIAFRPLKFRVFGPPDTKNAVSGVSVCLSLIMMIIVIMRTTMIQIMMMMVTTIRARLLVREMAVINFVIGVLIII